MCMRGNLQTRDANNGESEGINRSVSEHLFMALKKTAIPIVEDFISKGGIHSVQQVVDDSIGKVKDEIHSMVEEKLTYQNRNSRDEATASVPRDIVLKFLVQVSDPVLTGKEIRGKEGADIKIAIVDKVTEVPVGFEPQSSAKVEIYILDASVEDFDDSIIIANNKPHFRKRVFVHLKKGVGILPKNVKLRHSSRWTKNCECRLGARVVKNLDGSRIKEALTETFTVLDRRGQLYEKHDQPSLFDEVWRLKNIGKDGARCNRLRKKNVSTVQEFLFLHSVDPQGLQNIFGASPDRIWKSTVNHARKCDIDDKKIYLHCSSSSSSECKNGVVFDVVGQLKGILRNNSYVPIESVTEAEKDHARKLLAYAFENQKEAPASENKKKASAFENWNDIASFDDEASFITRDYELRFLVQVSDPVLTGEEIRGKDDTDIKIALYDQVTGKLVDSGPESSATVEILFLDAGVENFINSIIKADNKPQFRKCILVHLENGMGILHKNVKIRHGSHWMKSCKCRLGARVVNFFDGSRIKEASTDSFTVLDRRSKSKEKHGQPSLFDDVWRLENIAKDGARCNRLRKKNVSTVQEFLFLHSVDPQRLQEIFGASPDRVWKSTVNHARKCNIDDKRIYYLQYSSSSSSFECKNGVVFDVVGQLKGVLRNNGYVPIESVTNAEKDDARKLLAYAFENQKEAPASENKKKASALKNWNYIASFDDEASFLCEFPSITNDKNATISSWLDGPDGYNSSIVENINPTKPVTSSQGISPSINDSNGSSCWPSQCFSKFDFGNNDKIPRVESYSDHQSCAGSISFVVAVITIQWLLRVKKRVATSGDTEVQKRHRQS